MKERQLELSDIVGYFEHGLKFMKDGHIYVMNSLGYPNKTNNRFSVSGENIDNRYRSFSGNQSPSNPNFIKPILYDISCLTEEIEVNGIFINPIAKIRGLFTQINGHHRHFDYTNTKGFVLDGKFCGVQSLPYWVIDEFCKLHIDIHGLIPAGLAIDKKTIK